ncbi:Sec-independent protein translocase protein TatB [Sphingobium sp. WCS2017Hpa-17]|uniref:Sec-independent protein translocase protein TatB n=1 Tax=Sphingobium sp. WCS2017Hpa-17 TaxID=3073638 RepID=UPI002889B2FA|nr:Sec-independent protein translocase protein TatB [Sphingobium sp. WCS2017Hpa-17]
MFGIDSSEFLVIVIIAVIVIGPKDLPRALYKVGQIVGKAQGMARHFRTGIDAMVREVELEELEKKWAAQNKRIMEEHPPETSADVLPAPVETSAQDGGQDTPPYVAESAPVEKPPFVAESAPVAAPTVPVATSASDGPPYVADAAAAQPLKGDAAV